MKAAVIKPNRRPEDKIKDAICLKMRSYGWHVIVTHGNAYQSGLPDLYCMHAKYGYRWIEVKNPQGYAFTSAQQEHFPLFQSCGIGIWILTGAEDSDIDKLFQPPNWFSYLPILK